MKCCMVASLLIVFASVSLLSAQDKPKDDVESVKSSVAVVEGTFGHGTGFVILPKVIATNSHVIRDDLIKDIKVNFLTGDDADRDLKVELLYENKEADFALLHVPNMTDRKPIPLASKFEPSSKQKVFIIGNPAQSAGVSRVNALAEGIADELVKLNKRYFLHLRVGNNNEMIDVGPGNSGGPVVDSTGKLIGVLTAGMTENGKPMKRMFCIPLNDIKSALGKVGSAGQWKEMAQQANATHCLEICIVQMYINAKIAKLFIDDRIELTKKANGLAADYPSAQDRATILREALKVDQKMIAEYKTIDTEFQKAFQPAFKELNENAKLVVTKKMSELKGMKQNHELMRKTALKPSVTNNELTQCTKSIKNCGDFFVLLKADTGLTDEVFNEMLKSSLLTASAKLKKAR